MKTIWILLLAVVSSACTNNDADESTDTSTVDSAVRIDNTINRDTGINTIDSTGGRKDSVK